MEIIYQRADDPPTYVAMIEGLPYHITPDDPLYDEAQIAGANAPFKTLPPAPTEAEALAAWRETTTVTAYQAKAALFNRGLLDDAEAVVAGVGGLVLLAWKDADKFQRNAASIAALAPAIGITTPEDLDQLFREAEVIVE